MNNIALIVTILMLATIVEYLVNVIKPLLDFNVEYPLPRVYALVVGVGLSLLVGADFFVAVGFESVNPIAAQIITGVMISGGSTAIHELIAKLRASREDIQNEK